MFRLLPWQRTLKPSSSILILLCCTLLLLVSKVKGRSLDEDRLLTTTTSAPILDCQISIVDIIYFTANGTAVGKSIFHCHPIIDESVIESAYEIHLSSDIQTLIGTLPREEWFISITGGWVDAAHGMVVIPNSLLVQIRAPPATRRHLALTTGTLNALVVRVTDATGLAPTYQSSVIYENVFTKDVSLKWQMHKCSWGKLNIEPQDAGIIEVQIDLKVSTVMTQGGNYRETLRNAAAEAARIKINQQYGLNLNSIADYADLILYVLPPSGNWLAYASVGGKLTVFNDVWGAYIHALMHEVGHNLGLRHSNENGEYMDHTSYMSSAIYGNTFDVPKECYDAVQHWSLNWYPADRVISLDPYQPMLIKLAAFTDFDKTTAGQEVVIACSGNVCMQFNRKESFNSDVLEDGNMLVIVADQGTSTELIAALAPAVDKNTFQYQIQGQTWTVEICEEHLAAQTDTTTPDYMIVSIGFGNSLCGQALSAGINQPQNVVTSSNPSGSPTISPTSSPTKSPTSSPTNGPQCLSVGVACSTNSDCCSNNCQFSWTGNVCGYPASTTKDGSKLANNAGARDYSIYLGGNRRNRRVRGLKGDTELSIF